MLRAELKALADSVVEIVRGHVGRAIGVVQGRIDALEKRLDELPTAEKGDRGEKGEQGIDGPQGEPGERGEKGEAGPQGEAGPAGAPGEKGAAGRDGEPGSPGEKGLDGRDGRDGQPGLPGAKGADGRDGKDGADGLGFDDLSVEHDGDGGISLKFVRGDRVKEFKLQLPRQRDKGVFKDGDTYREGDGVTWAGSYWHAQKDAPVGKPGEPGSDGWRLSVKRGRDGRDGRDGIDKTAPVKL